MKRSNIYYRCQTMFNNFFAETFLKAFIFIVKYVVRMYVHNTLEEFVVYLTNDKIIFIYY